MARERYGIDAPGVVRTLALAGGACIIASRVPIPALRPFQVALLAAGGSMLATALWMLLSSLVLKLRLRDRLLAGHTWRGDEQVLDVGCGAGLAAIGAARRLTRGGRVTGIDLWQASDLSSNGPERLLANAAAAGVADRVAVQTGDMRALPFADTSFDVVTSMTAIHNVPSAAERLQAIDELWRVTRPGGALLIFDIRHARAYAARLRELGGVVQMSWPVLLWLIPGWRVCVRKLG